MESFKLLEEASITTTCRYKNTYSPWEGNNLGIDD